MGDRVYWVQFQTGDLIQPSFLSEPVDDFFYFGHGFGGGLFSLENRLVSLGKITGADVSHFGFYDDICFPRLHGGEL